MSTRLPRPLDAAEIRVLGVLLEKEQTTPEVYPLTVNALIAGANQKTNRDPVMDLSETEVVDALDRLREHVLVWRVEGARSERWKQSVSRRWGLETQAARALLTTLLLRGPQTVGELRSRSERLHAFESAEEVEATLKQLAAEFEPLVAELPRQPGRKEARWTHLVGDPTEREAAAVREPEEAQPAADPRPSLAARLDRLEETVARLAAELEEPEVAARGVTSWEPRQGRYAVGRDVSPGRRSRLPSSHRHSTSSAGPSVSRPGVTSRPTSCRPSGTSLEAQTSSAESPCLRRSTDHSSSNGSWRW